MKLVTNIKLKHKENYVNPLDGTHTNNIENFWTHMKNKMCELHGVYKCTPAKLLG